MVSPAKEAVAIMPMRKAPLPLASSRMLVRVERQPPPAIRMKMASSRLRTGRSGFTMTYQPRGYPTVALPLPTVGLHRIPLTACDMQPDPAAHCFNHRHIDVWGERGIV